MNALKTMTRDKTTISYTAIMGLREDTHLHGQDYRYALSKLVPGELVSTGSILAFLVYCCANMWLVSSALLHYSLRSIGNKDCREKMSWNTID